MSESVDLVKKFGLLGLLNLCLGFNSFILIPVLTKNMSSVDYGTWVQITIAVTLVPGIFLLGLPHAMVRFLAAEKDRTVVSDCFYSILVIALLSGVILALALFVFQKEVASIMLLQDYTLLYYLSLIVTLECLYQLFGTYYRTFQRILPYTLFTLVKSYLNIAGVAFAILCGYGLKGAVFSYLLTDLLVSAIMLACIVLEIGIRVPRFRNLKTFFNYGLPTVPGSVSSYLVSASDRFVIGGYLGASFVGYYATGYTIGFFVNMFVTPLSILLPPVLSKYYDEKNPANVRVMLDRSVKYFLMIAIPSIIYLSTQSRQILEVFSTPEIASNACYIAPLTAVSATMLGLSVIVSQKFLLLKKTQIIGKTWIALAFLNICMNLLLVPSMGILGAAVSSISAYTLMFLVFTYYSRDFMKISVDVAFMGKCTLSSVVMSVPLVLLNPSGVSGVVLSMILTGSLYVVSLLLLKGIKKEEVGLLKQMIGI